MTSANGIFTIETLFDALEKLPRPNTEVRASTYCYEGTLIFADTHYGVDDFILTMRRSRHEMQYLIAAHPNDLKKLGLEPGRICLDQDTIDRYLKRGKYSEPKEAP